MNITKLHTPLTVALKMLSLYGERGISVDDARQTVSQVFHRFSSVSEGRNLLDLLVSQGKARVLVQGSPDSNEHRVVATEARS